MPVFLHPGIPVPQQIDGFLYKALLSWIKQPAVFFPLIYPVISYALLITQAISVNKMVNDNRMLPRTNYLVGMSYLLITSMFDEWNMLSAPLIVSTVLIWAWARMSKIQAISNPKGLLFNTGMAIGTCTFFYFPSIAFILLLLAGLAIIRPFHPAEWLTSFLGILTPYYFLLAFVFLTDGWKGYHFPGVAFTTPRFMQNTWALISIALIMIVFLGGFYFVRKNFRRMLIQTRKSWNLALLYFAVAVLVPFINATHTFEYWILCVVPMAVYGANIFFYPGKKWLPQSLHWLMVGFVLWRSYSA